MGEEKNRVRRGQRERRGLKKREKGKMRREEEQ